VISTLTVATWVESMVDIAVNVMGTDADRAIGANVLSAICEELNVTSVMLTPK
jgi:hypothetical protein